MTLFFLSFFIAINALHKTQQLATHRSVC